jgi:hypothetical protein
MDKIVYRKEINLGAIKEKARERILGDEFDFANEVKDVYVPAPQVVNVGVEPPGILAHDALEFGLKDTHIGVAFKVEGSAHKHLIMLPMRMVKIGDHDIANLHMAVFKKAVSKKPLLFLGFVLMERAPDGAYVMVADAADVVSPWEDDIFIAPGDFVVGM